MHPAMYWLQAPSGQQLLIFWLPFTFSSAGFLCRHHAPNSPYLPFFCSKRQHDQSESMPADTPITYSGSPRDTDCLENPFMAQVLAAWFPKTGSPAALTLHPGAYEDQNLPPTDNPGVGAVGHFSASIRVIANTIRKGRRGDPLVEMLNMRDSCGKRSRTVKSIETPKWEKRGRGNVPKHAIPSLDHTPKSILPFTAPKFSHP